MNLHDFVGVVTYIFAIADPIGVVPVFLGYTQKLSSAESRRMAFIASVAVAGVLTLSILGGEAALRFFGLSLDDFRIAGGLLVLLMALQMFQGGHTDVVETGKTTELAVTPLALPMLAGPGLFSILITYSSEAPGLPGKLWLIAASIVASIAICAVLLAAEPLRKWLGTIGIAVTTRLMGLIVAALGVNFILTGLKNSLPGLL
ncbi:NAAT family transporter [bacterium]|nr:NAAT family transporter [bacterium]